MGDPPLRQPTNPNISVREENVAPQVVAKPQRPPVPVRAGHDDAEQVRELEKLERERAALLVQLQDTKQENKLLREMAPTVVFPPPSIPPPAKVPQVTVSSSPADIKAIEKMIVGSKLGRSAIVVGILAALAGNAFNMVRQQVPIQKAEQAVARTQQNEQLSAQESAQLALERQRTLQALRAIKCWAQQTRGGFQRQGLDLTSLPPGGIRVLRLAEEDPNRPPKPPIFIVDEKCPDFPELPPDSSAR